MTRLIPLLLLTSLLPLTHACHVDAKSCKSTSDCFVGEVCVNTQCRTTTATNASDLPTVSDLPSSQDQSTSQPDQSIAQCPEEAPTRCEDRCVNTENDPTACGKCETQCQEGDVCVDGGCKTISDCRTEGCSGLTWCDEEEGKCKPGCEKKEQCADSEVCNVETHTCECPGDTIRCEGVCVTESTMQCGPSCIVCDVPGGGEAICQGGVCASKCEDERELCGGECVMCPSGDSVVNTECQGMRCVATSCRDGFEVCDSGCCAKTNMIKTGVVHSTRDTGTYNAIALDAKGYPHISHYDDRREDLLYTSWNGTRWVTVTVDLVGDVGKHSDIAIDRLGRVHISYFDDSNDLLKHAVKEGQSWTISEVNRRREGGLYTSIAVDAQSRPHIAYFEEDEEITLYATQSANGSWSTEKVIAYQSSFSFSREPHPSIAIDRNGMPQIAVEQRRNIVHLRRAQQEWIGQSVGTSTGIQRVYGLPALVIDSSNNPSIAYRVSSASMLQGGVEVATQQRGPMTPWQSGLIHMDITGDLAFALSTQNIPHISYHEQGSQELKHATIIMGQVTTQSIDARGNMGTFNDIAVDAQGMAHVSYYDSDRDVLRYARWDGSQWLN